MNGDYSFETLQIHAGVAADPTGSRAIPLYQTTAYLFENAADAADQFSLNKPGSIYTRLGNPTTDVLEKRMAALEGGAGSVCFASGMAAIQALVTTLCEAGSEIVSISTLYGGTYTLFADRLPVSSGIAAHFVAPDDLAALEAAINAKTRFIYIETIGNPNINIPDIEGIAAIAHRHGLPLVADNTFATPYLLQCRDYGVDFTVYSLTKYLSGHGNSLGGCVADLGTFDFTGNPRFASFNQPDQSYHGIVYASLGKAGFLTKLRACVLRDTGACISPFNAYMILLGIETLSIRMERHAENAQRVAEHLSAHPRVKWVNYPGLEGDPCHERCKRYFKLPPSGILTFGIAGGIEAGRRFIDSLKLLSLVANVGDAKSLVIHPASTTHAQLSEEQLIAAGVKPEMIRLSIGIENVNDILADIDAALEKSGGND